MSKEKNFIDVLLRRIFQTVVGTSAARSMGAGIIKNVRIYWSQHQSELIQKLSKIDNNIQFKNLLDETTQNLCDNFTVNAVNGSRWGCARKFINLLFRELLYNFYTNSHLKFNRFEEWLEVPLDSHVAKGIQEDSEKLGLVHRVNLPKWDAIIRLTPEDNEKYQSMAIHIAKKRKVKRVHLDVFYWRDMEDMTKI